jgi:hypothetical protein
MNIFNRIVTIILLIVLLLLALVLAVFPVETLTVLQRTVDYLLTVMPQLESSYYWLYTVGRIGLVVVAVVIIGLLLWGELRPHYPKAVQVHTEAGSHATVTTESVARRLSWHVDQLADVITVEPTVTAHGKAVDVTMALETNPEVDVPMKTDEVVGVAREVITDRMGMQIRKIQVHISHAPYQDEV